MNQKTELALDATLDGVAGVVVTDIELVPDAFDPWTIRVVARTDGAKAAVVDLRRSGRIVPLVTEARGKLPISCPVYCPEIVCGVEVVAILRPAGPITVGHEVAAKTS